MKIMKNCSPNGIHYLISFFGCDLKQINSVGFWKRSLNAAIKKSKIKILHSYYYKFNPHGITCFLLLSSSHLSIHTWPEYQYVACDVFSCASKNETRKIIKHLSSLIKYKKINIKLEKRGYVV